MPEPASTVLPPNQYMVPQAEEMRRKMAMALMQGSGQEPKEKMTHPAQLFGNVANRVVGNNMFDKANEFGRKSDLHDASTDVNGRWGAERAAVPFAPPAPMSGTGGPGMPGGMGGVPPMRPPQAGWQDPTMTPPQGMPPGQPVPFMGGSGVGGGPMTPGSQMPPSGPELPNEGGMFGGLGYKPLGWPESLFNPQG